MIDAAALLLSAGLMGLASAPHCAAMCGAACAAASHGGGRGAGPALQAGRVAGYAAAGALAATGLGAIAWLGSAAPVMRPLWTLLHVAALALGLWMLATGRAPVWRSRVRSPAAACSPGWAAGLEAAAPSGGGAPIVVWRTLPGAPREGLIGAASACTPAATTATTATAAPAPRWAPRFAIGLAWIAFPCGLSQSALMLSALADAAWLGALAMAVFALGSSIGLVAAPELWRRLAGRRFDTATVESAAVRLAGGLVAGASAWALGHGLWVRFVAWCVA